jgi:glucokinase
MGLAFAAALLSRMVAKDILYLGVDIGGTKVAAGLVDASGEIICKGRAPMNAHGSAEEGLASVLAAMNDAMKLGATARPGFHLGGVGICSPGPLDPRTGVVINPPNLPCWRDFPLAERVSKEFGVPVRIENDANAAAFAESTWGAGRGYHTVFYATLGTGIGTGLVMDGRIYNGRTGSAPEGGHIVIDFHGPKCGCGKFGCIEALASGPAIAAHAKTKVAATRDRGAKLVELAGGAASQIQSEHVAQAWRAGDPLATEILAETMDLITVWLGNIVDLLEPEVIVIGGGIGELVSEWFPYIRVRLPAWCIIKRGGEIPIVLARYVADSGIAGAAALCLASGAKA